MKKNQAAKAPAKDAKPAKKAEATKVAKKKEQAKKATTKEDAKKAPAKEEKKDTSPAKVEPNEEKKEEPSKPKEIAFKELANLTKTAPGKKWFTLLDKTGNAFTFLKYQGNTIMTYSQDDMTTERLKRGCHAVITGYITTLDFKGDATEIISELIAKGDLPKEIVNPESFNTEEVYKLLKKPDDDMHYIKKDGMFIFLCSEEKTISKWMKENTDIIIVNP